MPTDGNNIHYPQLESIWKTFCLTDPIFHDTSFRGRLTDIVSNRVNITHGNLSAAEIGTRVTIQESRDRLNEVSALCSYFISVLENYIANPMCKYSCQRKGSWSLLYSDVLQVSEEENHEPGRLYYHMLLYD